MRREVRLLSLPVATPLATAHGTSGGDRRELTVVRLVDDESGHEGWGECAALNHPGYTAEWARGAFDLLGSRDAVDPVDHPMAAAALAAARLDLELRSGDRSLAEHLGVDVATVRAGATIGLGSAEAILARADELTRSGYRRLKIKIAPATGFEAVAAVRRRHPGLELQVDANGSFGRGDLDALSEADDLGVTVIEEPVGADDVGALAGLRARLQAKVFADEGSRPPARLDALLAAEAVDGVAVKPPCLGGIQAAVEMLDRLRSAGLDASIGGMLESSLGRHVLAVVAGHAAVSVTGDVSPSALWITGDPWPQLTMTDEGEVVVPSRPGLCEPPDVAALEEVTVDQVVAPHY